MRAIMLACLLAISGCALSSQPCKDQIAACGTKAEACLIQCTATSAITCPVDACVSNVQPKPVVAIPAPVVPAAKP